MLIWSTERTATATSADAASSVARGSVERRGMKMAAPMRGSATTMYSWRSIANAAASTITWMLMRRSASALRSAMYVATRNSTPDQRAWSSSSDELIVIATVTVATITAHVVAGSFLR